jgi:hypothetical protein
MNEEHKFLNLSLTGHEIMEIIHKLPRYEYKDKYNSIHIWFCSDIINGICEALEEKEIKP